MKILVLILIGVAGVYSPGGSADDSTRFQNLTSRISQAAVVLQSTQADAKYAIPDDLLALSSCIFVAPSIEKRGFIFTRRVGEGVMSCKTTSGWTNPAFMTIGRSKFRYASGAEATDLILVFTNPATVQLLRDGTIVLEEDQLTAVETGPLGRDTEVLAHQLKSSVYSYTRALGYPIAISVEGARLEHQEGDNEIIYGMDILPSRLLIEYDAHPPLPVVPFLAQLENL